MTGIMIQTMFLVTVILIVRKIFGERLHAYVRYSLWLLVAFRLLLPVNLVDSPVSILGGVEKAVNWYSENMAASRNADGKQTDAEASRNADGKQTDAEASRSADGKQTDAEASRSADGKQTDAEADRGVDGKQSPAENGNAAQKLLSAADYVADGDQNQKIEQEQSGIWWEGSGIILWAVWLLGSLLTGSLFIISYLHFRYILYKTRKLYSINDGLAVFLVKNLESPCLAGVFRPAVYLGTDVEPDSDLFRYAVLHEKVHYRHRDHLWAVLRMVLVAVYWFHPFVWIAAIASARDGEIACDYGTVKKIGEEERFTYGEMLLAFSHVKKGKRLYSYGTMLRPGKSELKERIMRLAEGNRMKTWAGILTVLLMAVLAGCAFTGAASDESKAQENEAVSDGSRTQERETASDSSKAQENEAAAENSVRGQDSQAEGGEFEEIAVKEAADVSSETFFGADGPVFDYAGRFGTESASVVMFHDYFGLIVYDLASEKMIRSLDLASIGCHMTQGDDVCQVAVAADGTTVWLHPKSKQYFYRYDVKDNRLYRQPLVKTFDIDLEGENLFDRYVVSEDTPTKYKEWQSNYLYEEYKDERGLHSTYIYLYISHGEELKLGSLELVWDDMVFMLKWDDMPAETEGFPLRYQGVVEDVDIIYDKPCNYVRISNVYEGRVHPITQEMEMHEGIDFVAKEGTDITAAADGVVYETGYSAKYGNYVVLLHINGDMTYYCQCRKVIVQKDEQVKRGQKIATVGITGQATGPHLHFALSRHGDFVDPAESMQNVLQLE